MTAILRSKRWVMQFAMLALIALAAAFVQEISDPQYAQAQSSVRPPANAVTGPVMGTVITTFIIYLVHFLTWLLR